VRSESLAEYDGSSDVAHEDEDEDRICAWTWTYEHTVALTHTPTLA
jgi:hypothetical protein